MTDCSSEPGSATRTRLALAGSRYRWRVSMAVSIAGAWLVSLAAMTSRSLQYQWIDPRSPRYVALHLLPTLLLGGLTVGVVLAYPVFSEWFRRRPIMANTAGLALIGVSCHWVSRFPSSRRQLAAAALVLIVALIWLSLASNRFGFVLSASSFAWLMIVVSAVEVMDSAHRPLVWGEPSTMARTFPRDPPFIGPGGRLNPNLSGWMVRSGIEDTRRVWIHTNRLGFRNEDQFEPQDSQERSLILSLGDSFSNGFGIGQEDFYGALLQTTLQNSLERRPMVLNAEVSDPCYGLWFLQQFGFDYRPHLVILNLSGNDTLQSLWGCGPTGVFRLSDADRLAVRPDRHLASGHTNDRWQHYRYGALGDEEIERSAGRPSQRQSLLRALFRLRTVDRLRRRNPPHLRRDDPVGAGELTASTAGVLQRTGSKLLFDGFPSLGMAYREDLPPKEQSLATLFRIISSMNRQAAANGANFLVVYFPQRHQVQGQDWDVLRRRWGLDPLDFELGQEPRRIGEHCRQHGISFLDLSPAFQRAAVRSNLYLPYDGHPNEAGHALAAGEVSSWILEQGE